MTLCHILPERRGWVNSITQTHKLFPIITHVFVLSFSIWPIDKILSGATTPVQRGPRSSGNEVVLHILQILKTGVSPSDSLLSYPVNPLGGLTYQQICSVFYSLSQPGLYGLVGWVLWHINLAYICVSISM